MNGNLRDVLSQNNNQPELDDLIDELILRFTTATPNLSDLAFRNDFGVHTLPRILTKAYGNGVFQSERFLNYMVDWLSINILTFRVLLDTFPQSERTEWQEVIFKLLMTDRRLFTIKENYLTKHPQSATDFLQELIADYKIPITPVMISYIFKVAEQKGYLSKNAEFLEQFALLGAEYTKGFNALIELIINKTYHSDEDLKMINIVRSSKALIAILPSSLVGMINNFKVRKMGFESVAGVDISQVIEIIKKRNTLQVEVYHRRLEDKMIPPGWEKDTDIPAGYHKGVYFGPSTVRGLKPIKEIVAKTFGGRSFKINGDNLTIVEGSEMKVILLDLAKDKDVGEDNFDDAIDVMGGGINGRAIVHKKDGTSLLVKLEYINYGSDTVHTLITKALATAIGSDIAGIEIGRYV